MIEFKCQGCHWLNDKHCHFGRLLEFSKNGAIIDFSQNSPVIQGRGCNAYRKSAWADGKDKANLELILRAENLVRTDIVIYIEKYEHTQLEATIESLKTQLLKPLVVRVICNCRAEKAKLIKLMDDSKLTFFITEIKQPMTKNQCIDYVIKKSNASYYQILDPGQILHKDWLAEIDEAINDKCKRFLFVEGDNTKGDLVGVAAHLNFYGNEPCQSILFVDKQDDKNDTKVLRNIKEKLEFAGKVHGNEYYIVKPEYILSST